MQVRCFHCSCPVELGEATALDAVCCTECGETFNLIYDETLPLVSPGPGGGKARPRTIGRFELIDQLGQGGYGTVWMARDPHLDRIVALKVPRTTFLSPEETDKFLREARAAAQLKHPNIVGVHEVGRDGDTVYIVSDYVRGHTLADELTNQRLSAPEAAELTATIAEALHHAHEAGVIHRDLKPGNIMLSPRAGGSAIGTDRYVPCVMDFGLARREAGEATMTVDGQILGTPYYMSPEQAGGQSHAADRRSDVYSLGVILYLMLTRELPFRGNYSRLMAQILEEEPPAPRRLDQHVPRDLETICLKCLEKNPQRRYQTAAALADDLRRWLGHEPIRARPVGRAERVVRWCRRKPWAAVSLALLIAGLGSTSAALWRVRVLHRQTQQARHGEQLSLRDSLFQSARALRQSTELRHRSSALQALRAAAVIRPGAELRDEYLRCLELPELRAVRQLYKEGWNAHCFAAFRGEDSVLVVPTGNGVRELSVRDGSTIDLIESVKPLGRAPDSSDSDKLYPIALSANGQYLAGTSPSGDQVRLIDLHSGREEGRLDGIKPQALAFDSRSRLLAVAAKTRENPERAVISLYALPSLRLDRVLKPPPGTFADCLRFSPDSKLLAASADVQRVHTLQLWDLAEQSLLKSENLVANIALGRAHASARVDFGLRGRLLAAACADGTVRIWDTARLVSHEASGRAERYRLPAHRNQASVAQFSPDGRWLVTGDPDDEQLKLWSVATGELAARAELPVMQVQWSNSGTRLLCSSTESVWLVEFTPPLSRLYAFDDTAGPDIDTRASVESLQLSHQGRWLAWSHSIPVSQQLVDTHEPHGPIVTLEATGMGDKLVFSRDERRLARSSWDGSLREWTLAPPKIGDSGTAHKDIGLGIGFNRRGHRISVRVEGETLRVQNMDTGDILVQFTPRARNKVQFDGTTQLMVALRGRDLVFSPEADFLALVDGPDRTKRDSIHVFDLAHGTEILSDRVATSNAGIALAEEARIIAVAAGNRTLIYEPHHITGAKQLAGHAGAIGHLAVDAAGCILASAGAADATVRLWDVEEGVQLATFSMQHAPPVRVALSGDGRWLAAGDSRGNVQLWDLRSVNRHLAEAGLTREGSGNRRNNSPIPR